MARREALRRSDEKVAEVGQPVNTLGRAFWCAAKHARPGAGCPLFQGLRSPLQKDLPEDLTANVHLSPCKANTAPVYMDCAQKGLLKKI